MDIEHLIAIERWNLRLSLLLVAGTGVLWPRAAIIGGVALGCAVTCSNFAVLRRLAQRLLVARSKGLLAAIFLGKMVALFTVVGLLLRYVPMNRLAFVAGVPVFLLSIFVVALQSGLAGGGAAPANLPETGEPTSHG